MSETEAVVREPKVIKRYTNRKLYDTVESRYVTLDEIAEMVKQGVEVKIVDNRTKEDLTSVTLAQIVFEEEKKKNQMPLSVLREIIRQPGERINEFINTQVNPRVEAMKEQGVARINTLLGREQTEDVSPAALIAQSQKVFEAWQTRVDERVKAAVENVVGSLPALGRDLSTLVARLESLENKLKELEEAQAAQQSAPSKKKK
ncbi:MAG: polyhydroxyalkanoate synthesis regulator DNA-binding domain-containing protein [Archangium sp.]